MEFCQLRGMYPKHAQQYTIAMPTGFPAHLGATTCGLRWYLMPFSSIPINPEANPQTSGTLSCGLSNGLKKLICLTVCPMRVTLWSPADDFFIETATPMPHASGRSPGGGDRHGRNHTSSGALCVEISELTSSIPKSG